MFMGGMDLMIGPGWATKQSVVVFLGAVTNYFWVSCLNEKIDFTLESRIETIKALSKHMGVSENSVALNPMVNDHYPY